MKTETAALYMNYTCALSDKPFWSASSFNAMNSLSWRLISAFIVIARQSFELFVLSCTGPTHKPDRRAATNTPNSPSSSALSAAPG